MAYGGYVITQQDGTTRIVQHSGTLQMLINAGEVRRYEKHDPLAQLNRDEIRDLAKKHDIAGRGRMSKDQLVAALKAL